MQRKEVEEDLHEDDLRNLDQVILEKCCIDRPRLPQSSRTLCMLFCYYERGIEVFSDEEGVEKAISGF